MLPKIQYPVIKINVQGVDRLFRPILVREEKILLTAKTTENSADIFTAIFQVVNNCSIDDTFNIESLSINELEYIFLRLRGFSIGNKLELSYIDNEDNMSYEFEVDLETIALKGESIHEWVVKTEDIAIVMTPPKASLYTDSEFLNTSAGEINEALLIKCISKIYAGDETYDATIVSVDELKEFIDNLDMQTYKKMREFFSKLPYMEHVIEYKNSLGHDRTIVLRTLNDFFIL